MVKITQISRAGRGFTLAVGLIAALGTGANAETIYGVSDSLNTLFSFDSSNPQDLTSAYSISGLANNEQIRGIDWIGDTLYGLGSQSHLYTINPNNGVATLVGPGFTPALDGIDFGFNAGTSQLYVSSDLGQNLTLNPITGAATVGPNYTGAPIDAMSYDYANGNFYGLSAETDNLYLLNPATGTETLIGPSGISFAERIGFDISPSTDTAYFGGTVSGQSDLYSVNLSTGAFTLIGPLAPDELSTATIDSIAVVPEPASLTLIALGGGFAVLLFRRKR